VHRSLGRGLGEVEGEVLGDGFDGRFAGVVGRVAGRVRDALFAAGYDDGFLRAGGVGFEEGEEGVDAVYYAEEVWGRWRFSLGYLN